MAVCLLFIGRLTYVEGWDPYVRGWRREWTADETLSPVRGTIYDASGDVLAFDAQAYSLDMDLPLLRQEIPSRAWPAFVSRMAAESGAPVLAVEAQLRRTDTVWLRWYPYFVHVPLPRERKLLAVFRAFHVSNAVTATSSLEREYPAGSFASDVVGFVDSSGHGAGGVEYQYNRYLQGRPGSVRFTQDAAGNPVPFAPDVTRPAQNGDSVYLTINQFIQYDAQQVVDAMVKRFHLRHAAVIVADPYTGAILAMAVYPDYNPNEYWRYPAATLDTNWAISDPFEPGSTFKVVTMTGALATHAITLNQTYMSGVDYVNGVPIHDWNWWGWGRITFRQALLLSSNTGFIHIGQAEGPMTLAAYIHKFGMDRPTGIDLPGEGTSITFNPRHENAVDFATSTFGQGLAVTPIQQVQMIGAVANGGLAITPYVVQKIVAPDGRVVYRHRTHVVDRVAPRSIMQTMTSLLVQSVSVGIANSAYVPGYQVAGKTGTAEIPKPGGGYYANAYNLSFVGFAPASHPRFDLFVTAEDMHTQQLSDAVAGPAAQRLIQSILAYDHVPPSGTPVAPVQTGSHPVRYVVVPDLTGHRVSKDETVLRNLGMTVLAVGHTGRVAQQWPAPGTREAAGKPVALITDVSVTSAGDVPVPDLRGLPMSGALRVCALLGLRLYPVGNGYVEGQSVRPGTRVPVGSTLRAQFTTPMTG